MNLIDKIKDLFLLYSDFNRYNRGEIFYVERDTKAAENLLKRRYIFAWMKARSIVFKDTLIELC